MVTEDGLRDLLTSGYLIEVICNQTAEKRHNSWYGSLVVHAVTEDGQDAKMLVTSRSVFKLREFKTIVGLVSFLADMGCLSANIPLIRDDESVTKLQRVSPQPPVRNGDSAHGSLTGQTPQNCAPLRTHRANRTGRSD